MSAVRLSPEARLVRPQNGFRMIGDLELTEDTEDIEDVVTYRFEGG